MFLRIPKIICALLLGGVVGCTPDSGQQPQLMVFAAASLRDVMTEVGSRFEQQHGIHVNYNFAGSNVLARQLLATPRADLFISANKAGMRRLEQAGRIVPGSHQVVLGNRLVVIVNHASTLGGNPRELFCTPGFEYLSMGNPEAVPAGIYAREWLEKLTCEGGSAWDAVAAHIVPAPDVRAALGLVAAEQDIPGIVYATDAAMSDKVRVIHEMIGNDAPVISYYAALVDNESSHDRAKRFLGFLSGEQATEVFRRYGFTSTQS
ncbi:MAG: molybdate ABC transporter substrate-binding protein [Gammaproteobacteria bacterium]|nr:molybdate ABC transporter substrate-binding protein [Gammaproteobacteria bacterium]